MTFTKAVFVLPVVFLIRLILEVAELVADDVITSQHVAGFIVEIILIAIDIIVPAFL